MSYRYFTYLIVCDTVVADRKQTTTVKEITVMETIRKAWAGFMAFIIWLCSLFGIGCGRSGEVTPETTTVPASIEYSVPEEDSTEPEDTTKPEDPANPAEPASDVVTAVTKTLVVYFSATGNTEKIAQTAAEALDADIYEITPAVPYTAEDLNYNDSSSRATAEQNDPSARPEITGTVSNWEQYNTVLIGYPIWWGDAPRIISTFAESYDFTGKTVTFFCTSGSSGISTSVNTLKKQINADMFLEGKRFPSDASSADVLNWLTSIGLAQTKPDSDQMKINISINGKTFTATLENNDAAKELYEIIKTEGLKIEMSDYSGFEKVGPLGKTLPADDEQTKTSSGDIVLYNGNQIVIFYGSNSWSYTRLGKIDDLSGWEEALGGGDITAEFSVA